MEYTIYQAPIQSFYNKKFYRSIGREGRGTGFLYLFGLFSICWFAIIISCYYHLIDIIDQPVGAVSQLVTKLPNMTFKEGVLSIDRESPYEFEVNGKKIVFDTSSKTSSINDYEGASALITQEKIDFEDAGWREPATFKKFVAGEFTLRREQIKPFLKDMSIKICLLGALLGIPTFFGHMFLALIYSAVGMIINPKPGFETALRMAICAMTPGVLISTLLSVLWINLLLQGLITVPLTLGYLVWGYRCFDAE